jgi:bile acid:Na+ symporter, BASS family
MESENQIQTVGSPSRSARLWRLYGRTSMLVLAITAGALFPEAKAASGWIPYLLMGMLFFAFLDISIRRESFHWSLLGIFLANILLPFAIFFLLRAVDPDLALVGYLTAVTPTATAAPVVVGFLRGKVDYVVNAVLLTNVGIALLLPFTLPLVAGSSVHISTMDLLPSVLEVMFVPLGLALLSRLLPASARNIIRRGKPLAFPLWLLVLFLVTSQASAFIQNNRSFSVWLLLSIALISLAICAVNFALGGWIGGRAFRREASQALGQKNNSFTIWVALAYLTPLTALGPTCYVIYHNLYNGYQLYEQERSEERAARREKAD